MSTFFPPSGAEENCLVFFFFSFRYPQCVTNTRKILIHQKKICPGPLSFYCFCFLNLLVVLVWRLEGGRGGLPEISASLRLKAFFSLTLCLIEKLGDSYLWQLRDSTHGDPPTVEGRRKDLWHQHALFHWHGYGIFSIITAADPPEQKESRANTVLWNYYMHNAFILAGCLNVNKQAGVKHTADLQVVTASKITTMLLHALYLYQ